MTIRRSGGASGFDFTGQMRRLCCDMVARLPVLSHINLDHVLVVFSRSRKRTAYGLYASLTPMRFQNGALIEQRRGGRYTVQRLADDRGREILYLLTFYLPRFMDLGFRAKLVTVLHELWHISPHFNGDLRRHPGRCYAHTHSQQEYDVEMGKLADQWLEASPPEDLYSPLQGKFGDLAARYGRVHGTRIRRPKLVRLP